MWDKEPTNYNAHRAYSYGNVLDFWIQHQNIANAQERRADTMALKDKKAAAAAAEPKKSQGEKAAYVNEVQFSGNLTRDLELSFLQNGHSMLKSGIAVWQPGGSKEAPSPTMFFDLILWEPDETKEPESYKKYEDLTENNNFAKGQRVRVWGRLGMRIYKEKPYYTITLRGIEDDTV